MSAVREVSETNMYREIIGVRNDFVLGALWPLFASSIELFRHIQADFDYLQCANVYGGR